MTSNTPLLAVSELSMQFGGIIALNKVSFDVQSNSITALIGPNGAGKTTLFNCLTGFYKATAGQLTFISKNQPVNIREIIGDKFKLKHLSDPSGFLKCLYYKMFGGSHLVARKGLARTFQNIRLFKEMTVIENLLVAQHSQANRNLIAGLLNTNSFTNWEKSAINNASEWLERFDLLDDANRLAGELAYGKQRHLEIARAMCTKPTLICLDEPAAGLNPHETAELSEKIKQLRKEFAITVLLIEHDMSMIMQISDQIVVLDHGEVIAKGNPEQIKNNPQVIEAYLGKD